MSTQDADVVPAARPAAFDPLTALDDLLSAVGLARAAAGGTVSIAGQDPILPLRAPPRGLHRHPDHGGRRRGRRLPPAPEGARARPRPGPAPGRPRHQPGRLLASGSERAPAPHPLVLDNPFLLTPYQTADGRWIMASGVYPHLAAR